MMEVILVELISKNRPEAIEILQQILLGHVDTGGNKFNINYRVREERQRTLLHLACAYDEEQRNPFDYEPEFEFLGNQHPAGNAKNGILNREIIRFLMRFPGVDGNLVDCYGYTALHLACLHGKCELVVQLLRCPHVYFDVNQQDYWGASSVWLTSRMGNVKMMEILMASGRWLDFTVQVGWEDVEMIAFLYKRKRIIELIKEFKQNEVAMVHKLRMELKLREHQGATLFAMVIFLCDGYYQFSKHIERDESPIQHFFELCLRLPMEIQMLLCNRAYESPKSLVGLADSETALKFVARCLA